MKSATQITPPVLDRYESKFVIPEAMVEQISDFVSPYCSLDKYSEKTADNYYGVNNLYFDTPYFLFIRNRLLGCDNRFNMRVRSYGDNPSLPYFLEIKQKKGNIIQKYRGRVYDADWYRMFSDSSFEAKKITNDKEEKNKQLFQKLAHIYNAEPKVLTQYRRKAFVSECEEYARVTFDRELRYMAEDTYTLIPKEDRMVGYDISTKFDPECSIILELKCYTSHVPYWMIDLIRAFDLRRRSFSKYITGVQEVLELFMYDMTFKEPVLDF